MARDAGEDALDAFRAAAACGNSPEAYYNLANALAKQAKRTEAVSVYRQALELRTDYADAFNKLSVVLVEMGRPAEAVEASTRAIAIAPDVADHHLNMGNALRNCGQIDEATVAYHQALTLQPRNAEIYVALGNIYLQSGDQVDKAYEAFHQAYRYRPLDKRAATKPHPDFSVLFINTPDIANTPVDYLAGGAGYDSYFYTLFPDSAYDLDVLRSSGDVVVNQIAEEDISHRILPQAIHLIDNLERPVINHPRKILGTSREQISQRLSGMPRCRVPKTIRCPGAALMAAAWPATLAEFSFPLLLRTCGTHGGDEFGLVAAPEAVAELVARQPGADYYLIEYIPYESADGYFRKYRFIFVDGQILPYHLAIGDRWKVHHYRTDMANQAWMREEEEAFVRDPAVVFSADHFESLRQIQSAIGLDYFGIDCSLDRNGDLVVFEVNATMLVHGETGIFAYKEPYITRIKDAFDAMLTKAVQNKGFS
ncbi:MAG: tetratricopeptide repeat protein [Rhodospirillaceae bacterium]|nr:MAG: tetratricopeptide repeat protein [Rhodospirillaceae bacterium]